MLHALRSTSKGLAASEINTNHSQDHYQTIFSTTGILALITSAEGESIGEPGIFIYQNSLVDVPRRRRKQITLSLECSSTVSVRNLAFRSFIHSGTGLCYIGCGQNVSEKRLWQTLNLKSYLRGQITCPSDLCVHQGLFFWPHELISASKLLTVVLTQQFSMLVLFVLNSLSLSQRRVLEWPQRPYDLRHRWPTTRWLYQPVLPALCPTQQVLCRKKLWKLCV